jgi:hypothetical protein
MFTSCTRVTFIPLFSDKFIYISSMLSSLLYVAWLLLPKKVSLSHHQLCNGMNFHSLGRNEFLMKIKDLKALNIFLHNILWKKYLHIFHFLLVQHTQKEKFSCSLKSGTLIINAIYEWNMRAKKKISSRKKIEIKYSFNYPFCFLMNTH